MSTKLDKYRTALAIDRDNMDDCIADHPELFNHVSEAYVLAVADKDAAKLALEEAEAEEDARIRRLHEKEKIRSTDAKVKQAVKGMERIKTLQREYLDCKLESELWQVLKESYTQRSYMIRALVDLFVKRMSSSSSISGAKEEMSNYVRGQVVLERRRQRANND